MGEVNQLNIACDSMPIRPLRNQLDFSSCYWAVREGGVSMVEISRRFELSLSGVNQSVKRGGEIAQRKGYKFTDS